MENNYQSNENAQVTYEAPPVYPVYNNPVKQPFNMPVMVSFLMKLTAFFIPGFGFILGCLVNLTPYDNKAQISHSILKLSAAMFVITLIILAVGGLIAFLTMFLNFDVPVGTMEGFEEVIACIF
ncbi:MAG: hypothetical protein IKU41_07135 [Clostridia bacterium]|nr:hypothetical protein [Clostridia bacterium]